VAGSAPELICPAGGLPALKTAVDEGADAVYLGFRDATNARNFAGLNFDEEAASAGIHYANARGAKVLVAINTYPQPAAWSAWTRAVDRAAALGADAVMLADLGLLDAVEWPLRARLFALPLPFTEPIRGRDE
jgi:putative protease